MSKKIKILLVDDEMHICKGFDLLLTNRGYLVDSKTCATEALKAFVAIHYDIVITDINLPGMSGLELIPEIRKVNDDIPIIVMTGHVGCSTEAMDSGANEILYKPFGFKQLCEHIDSLVQMSSAEREMKRLQVYLSTVIEENKQLRENLKSSSAGAEEIHEKNAMLTTFVRAIIHDLHNELYGIKMSTMAMEELDQKKSDIKSCFKLINRNLGYSTILLQRLRDYLHMGEIKLSPIYIEVLMDKLESFVKPRLKSTVEYFSIIKDSAKGGGINVNSDQLTSVLLELIQNASRSLTRENGIIELEINRNQNDLEISIKDNGSGIPDEIKDKLFNEQVESNQGLGLGLYLSNSVITKLGGSLRLAETSSNGTTFIVALPLVDESETK